MRRPIPRSLTPLIVRPLIEQQSRKWDQQIASWGPRTLWKMYHPMKIDQMPQSTQGRDKWQIYLHCDVLVVRYWLGLRIETFAIGRKRIGNFLFFLFFQNCRKHYNRKRLCILIVKLLLWKWINGNFLLGHPCLGTAGTALEIEVWWWLW